jgi:hypothetical protein
MSLDATFYRPSITTLAEAKSMALEQLRRVALLNEERGVVVNDLMPVDPGPDVTFATDADAQSRLWEAYQALARGTITTVEWEDTDGAFHELEQPLVEDFGEQAAQCMVAFVCACRSHHAALAAIINACATIDEVLEVDLSDGWPSNVCTGGLPHGNPYVLTFDAPGVPTDGMIVFHHTFRMAVHFPASMSNSAVKGRRGGDRGDRPPHQEEHQHDSRNSPLRRGWHQRHLRRILGIQLGSRRPADPGGARRPLTRHWRTCTAL